MIKILISIRLNDISEEFSTQVQPRRRSNSLPIPKIEISIYQSPEMKQKEEKDFIEVPEIKDVSLLAGKAVDTKASPILFYSDTSYRYRNDTSILKVWIVN